MNKHLLSSLSLLFVFAVVATMTFPTRQVLAATCTALGCYGLNPYGTT